MSEPIPIHSKPVTRDTVMVSRSPWHRTLHQLCASRTCCYVIARYVRREDVMREQGRLRRCHICVAADFEQRRFSNPKH